MRPSIRRIAPLAAAAAFLIGTAAAADPGAKAITWQTNFKKALAVAANQKKILMVDFYADW